MDIKARFVEKKSEKGNVYYVVEIPITTDKSITLFLNNEQALLLQFLYKPKGQ